MPALLLVMASAPPAPPSLMTPLMVLLPALAPPSVSVVVPVEAAPETVPPMARKPDTDVAALENE